MCARCAERSVTDCAIVEAGDSTGETDGDGVALGSAANAVRLTKPINADKTLVVFIINHPTKVGIRK